MSEEEIVLSFDEGPKFKVVFVVEEIIDGAMGKNEIVRTEFRPKADLEDFLLWLDEDFDFERAREYEEMSIEDEYSTYVNDSNVYIDFENDFIYVEHGGLHYICQHSFDIFPREIKKKFYQDGGPYSESMAIGYLHPLNGERLLVKSEDIDAGFMLRREEINKVGNFSDWIKWRRDTQ